MGETMSTEKKAPGEIEGVVATVESSADELLRALDERLTAVEEKLAQLGAGAEMHAHAEAQGAHPGHVAAPPARRTAATAMPSLWAKGGAEENAGGVAAVDAALRSLPVEQRLAVKGELLRAGLL